MTPAPSTPQHCTAAQIAAALGKSRQWVQWQLLDTPSAGREIVNGEARAQYALAALPAALRAELEEAAIQRGCPDASQLVSSSPKTWEPRIPLSEVAPAELQKAQKLMLVLRPFLGGHDDQHLASAEVERQGVEDYGRIFGHAISARYFRVLLHRTMERAGGAGQWDRLALYLDEHPARKAKHPVIEAAGDDRAFPELLLALSHCRTPGELSDLEQANLWVLAVENFAAQVEAGERSRSAKAKLLDFLWRHAPWLAKTPNALRVAFDRRLERWQNSENSAVAMLDGRRLRKGKEVAQPYEQDSVDAVVWHAAAHCGGRVSQAVRELSEREMLDPQIVRMLMGSSSKSYVPARLRDAVRADVRMMSICRQGPHAVDEATPSLSLHYGGIYAMTAMMADDFTLNSYVYVEDGQGWYKLTRGQCLLVIDFRTLMILGFAFLPTEQYHSTAIRTVFTRIFAERGLPKILYLERGIWLLSKLVTGGPRARRMLQEDDLPYNWGECELGLRQYGIEFIHAKRARSKPIERVGGLLQDLMQGEPGYCGRDERRDRPEALTRQMAEVESRKVHPSKYFYSVDQWVDRIEQIAERYNATAQEGKRLNGLSPAEAFEQLQNLDDPPTRLPASCRYLLAHHEIPVTVNDNGIVFRVRGKSHHYFGPELGPYRYQKMTAWFNPELPDILTVTDMNKLNAFTLERHQEVSALAAVTGTQGAYEQEVAKAAGFNTYLKTRYRVLKLKFAQTFRQNLVDNRTVALGEQMAQQKAEIQGRRLDESKRAAAIQRKAHKVGMSAALAQDGPESTDRGLQLLIEALGEKPLGEGKAT